MQRLKVIQHCTSLFYFKLCCSGKGVILISSEEGETDCNNDKFLKDFGLVDGNVLVCDDFLQNYKLKVGLIILMFSSIISNIAIVRCISGMLTRWKMVRSSW